MSPRGGAPPPPPQHPPCPRSGQVRRATYQRHLRTSPALTTLARAFGPRQRGTSGLQWHLQILAGVRDRVDAAACLGALLARDQGPDVDDALALLAGDARPVVGVGG